MGISDIFFFKISKQSLLVAASASGACVECSETMVGLATCGPKDQPPASGTMHHSHCWLSEYLGISQLEGCWASALLNVETIPGRSWFRCKGKLLVQFDEKYLQTVTVKFETKVTTNWCYKHQSWHNGMPTHGSWLNNREAKTGFLSSKHAFSTKQIEINTDICLLQYNMNSKTHIT